MMFVAAASYLFTLTETHIERILTTIYQAPTPYNTFFWGPYDNHYSYSMLNYAASPGASSSVANDILSQKENRPVWSINDYNNETDFVPCIYT